MPDRLPIPSSSFAPAPSRRTVSRQLMAIDDAELVTRAVVAAENSVVRARVQSIVHVTEAAMLGAGHIASVEGCLVRSTPWAEPRLRGIADAGCLGLQSLVLRHAERQG